MVARPDLILGLGNDLIADDGFGPAVAGRFGGAARGEAVLSGLAAPTDGAPDRVGSSPPDGDSGSSRRFHVETASVAGFRLLDLLAGHRRVLILDAVKSGRYPPGTLLDWPVERASCGRTLGGSHQIDLATAFDLGRSLGYDLPDSVTLLVVEAADLETIREQLTVEVSAAVPVAVRLVKEWTDQTGPFAPGARRNDDGEPRTLP